MDDPFVGAERANAHDAALAHRRRERRQTRIVDGRAVVHHAEAAGLLRVGETTGASLSSGKMLLVLADRASTDRDGKKIQAIAHAFRGEN